MNRKASILDIFVWMALGFVIILFFAIWIYSFNEITEALDGMKDPIFQNTNDTLNSISNISADIFGEVNAVQKTSIPILAFVIIFITALSIPLTYFIQRSHPAFFIVYIFITIAAFITSVYISNQYETLLSNEILGQTLNTFTAAGFIMKYLPIWVSVLGLGGAIFLFSGIIRDASAGGSIV